MKKICYACSIFLIVTIFTNFSSASAVSWYCVRNNQHRQPDVDKSLSFCEKYNAFWCDKKHQSMDGEKVIYLTFDAGYENGNVEKIVDILNEENVKGAFFVLDNILLKNKDLIEKMISNGHIIANHTFKHRDMTKVNSKEEFSNELKKLEDLYYNLYGEIMPKYYRPPEGKLSEENLKWAQELGYTTVMWSFAYDDWDNNKQPSKEYAMKKIYSNIHNGEIMLLHPTSKTNSEILRGVIQELKSQGFRFGTLDELCQK